MVNPPAGGRYLTCRLSTLSARCPSAAEMTVVGCVVATDRQGDEMAIVRVEPESRHAIAMSLTGPAYPRNDTSKGAGHGFY